MGMIGCGGPRTAAFGTEMRPLAESMQRQVNAKNLEEIKKLVATAEKFQGTGKMGSDEVEAFRQIQTMAEQKQWEKASDYIARCLREGK